MTNKNNCFKFLEEERMKSILLIIILSQSACAQLKTSTFSKEQEKKSIAEAQTQKVIISLQQKPEWLFTDEVCPADIMPDVEKKIEYKAAGCADNPDKCLEKCQMDDANACYALSLLLNEQRGREEADTQALYLRACKLGIVSGCTNNAAGKLNIAPEDNKTVKCSADTFEKACLKNDSWGCAMYGLALGNGSGREQNTGEALKVLQKTCSISGSESSACQSARKTEELIKEIEQSNKTLRKSSHGRLK